MRQQILRIGFLAISITGFFAAVPLLAEGESPGRKVFDDQKCNLCHAVSAVGIEAKTKSEKLKGPDLTDVSKSHQAPWLAQYLKKEVDKNGKAHTKPFKGSDEELQALVDWLLELKAPE